MTLDYRELDFSIVAFIDESRCIGCAKCIHACPVDAILGAHKYMHSVIANECTGCKRCLEPCPVDCIVMMPVDEGDGARPSRPAFERAIAASRRAEFRTARLAREEQACSQAQRVRGRVKLAADPGADLDARRQFIAAAVERVRRKRLAHEWRPPPGAATPDE